MIRKCFMMLLVTIFIALMPLLVTAQEANDYDAQLKAQPEQGGNNMPSDDVLKIVYGGQANAVVIIADNAGQVTEDAASTLVDYVEKSTGVRLPIKTLEEWSEGNADDVTEVYIGENGANEDPNIEQALQGLNGDVFLYSLT